MSFDWRTDEDERGNAHDWDTPLQTENNHTNQRRPPWRIIVLIGALLVLAGALVWWRVDQRVDAATEAVRNDVIASHNLVQRAASEGDEELFRSFLSGRDPAWTAGQIDLFRNRMMADRAAFGLTPSEGSLPAFLPLTGEEVSAEQATAAVDLSPDLHEAMLTMTLPYEAEGTGPIILQQTSVYRRGDQRWLLAPPSDEFWGEWQTTEGQYLGLIYPQRDEAIAGRLATDLDGLIARMCATLVEIDCSADLYLTVRLSEKPSALAVLSEPLGAMRRARERGDILELPTPTLIGLPAGNTESAEDEAYQALLRGYARHVLGATMARVTGWECCVDEALFEILQTYQLSRLGLATWPVSRADYERVLAERIRLSDVMAEWRNLPSDPAYGEQTWQVYTAIDFFLNATPGVSAADMQRLIGRIRSMSRFADDLAVSQLGLDREAWIPGSLDEAWWLYAFSGELSTNGMLAERTTEDLYMVCTSVEGNSSDPSALFQYMPERSEWRELYRINGFIWMSPLPNAQTMLMQQFSWQDQRWQAGFWRNGELSTVFDAANEYTISFGETNPAGDRMVTYAFNQDDGGVRAMVVDPTACEGQCATKELPGLPTWSPDGSKAIYTGRGAWLSETTTLFNANGRFVLVSASGRFQEQPLALGSGEATSRTGFIDVGYGYSPFWLDEQTFGFIQEGGSIFLGPRGEQKIVMGTVSDPTLQTILVGSDLLQFLPDGQNPRRLTLAYVATHPQQPGRLFVVALDELEKRAYVFLYDRATGNIELRLDMLYNLNHSLGFSPDGRYLVMTGQENLPATSRENSGLLLLHDIAQNKTTPFLTRLPYFLPSVAYDWSSKGDLLAIAMDDNLIGVVDPDEALVEVLPHNYGACTSVALLQP